MSIFKQISIVTALLSLLLTSCDKTSAHIEVTGSKDESRTTVVPSANMPFKLLLDNQSVDRHRQDSPTLNKIIEDLEQNQLIFSCQEVATKEGNRHLLYPSPIISNYSGMTYPDGRFIRIYNTSIGNGAVSVNDETKFASKFHLLIDYNMEGRGILIMPYWVILDRFDTSKIKILDYGLNEELISHIKQKRENKAQ